MVLAASPEGGAPLVAVRRRPWTRVRYCQSAGRTQRSQCLVIDWHCHLAGDEFAEDLERRRRAGEGGRLDRRAGHSRRPKTRPELRAGERGVERLARGAVLGRRASSPAGQFAVEPAGGGASGAVCHRRATLDVERSGRSVSTTTTTLPHATCSAGVSRADSARPDAAAPDCDSHPRGRGRHVADSGRGRALVTSAACSTALPAIARWRNDALDVGFPPVARRHRDLSAGARAEGSGADGAARSAAGRNRQPVSRPGPASRQTERAGARRCAWLR